MSSNGASNAQTLKAFGSVSASISAAERNLVYTPLEKKKKAVRLLTIQAGNYEDDICCTLEKTVLRKRHSPKYETISYCWGDSTVQSTVLLKDIPVRVPASSAAALRRVRLLTTARLVWIDAICIDQANIVERGHQVAMMKRIYTLATQNLVYLGEDDLGPAIQDCRSIVGQDQTENVISRTSEGQISPRPTITLDFDHEAIEHLLSNPWFRRVWTFQEAVLSRRNICYWRDMQVDLVDIVTAAAIIAYNYSFIGYRLYNLCFDVLGLYEIRHQREMGSRLNTLDVLSVLRGRDCSLGVDKVYGILGIQSDVSIAPDYSIDARSAFTNLAVKLINTTGYLGILHHVHQSADPAKSSNAMLSWVPDWSQSRDSRIQTSPLAKGYRANRRRITLETQDGDYKSDNYLFSLAASAEGLRVFGQQVGIIEDTVPLPTAPVSLTAITEIVNLANKYCDACTSFSAEHSSPEPETASACILCAERNIDTLDRLNDLLSVRALHGFSALVKRFQAPENIASMSDWEQFDAQNYETIMLEVCKNRCGFVAQGMPVGQRTGVRLGIGPQFLQRGDLVVVLREFEIPVVLRPYGDKFKFLGQAYVYGIMDGEVYRAGVPTTEFFIC